MLLWVMLLGARKGAMLQCSVTMICDRGEWLALVLLAVRSVEVAFRGM